MLPVAIILGLLLSIQVLRCQRQQLELDLLRYFVDDIDADLAELEGRVQQIECTDCPPPAASVTPITPITSVNNAL